MTRGVGDAGGLLPLRQRFGKPHGQGWTLGDTENHCQTLTMYEECNHSATSERRQRACASCVLPLLTNQFGMPAFAGRHDRQTPCLLQQSPHHSCLPAIQSVSEFLPNPWSGLTRFPILHRQILQLGAYFFFDQLSHNSTMDGVTALGLVCNIVQLVETGIKIGKQCKQVHDRGSLIELDQIEQ